MDCSENQYYDNSECRLCVQCGPGQELAEDCGFGAGGGGHCIPCSPRSYKDNWSHHSCRLCLSCKQVNRYQTLPCTAERNAVCGECLPGFYSKARIDGLQDLECIPCGTLDSMGPCTYNAVTDAEGNGTPSPQDAAATAICGATATVAIVLAVLLFICYRHVALKKILKGRPTVHHKSEDITVIKNGDTLILNMEKEVQVSEASVVTSDLQPSDPSSTVELEILMNNSTCSHCCSGSISQKCNESQDRRESQVENLSQGLNSADSYCASGQQGEHHHAPVECTELDFQNSAVPHGSDTHVAIMTPNELRDGSREDFMEQQTIATSAFSVQYNDRHQNTHLQISRNNTGCSNTVSGVLTLTRKSCAQMQGVHLGKLPKALVESLALKLDPSFPGVKNYQQVALELGIPLDVLAGLNGFAHVFHYLSSCTLCTVSDLISTFYNLQRLDVLMMLCEYATKSQTSNLYVQSLSP